MTYCIGNLKAQDFCLFQEPISSIGATAVIHYGVSEMSNSIAYRLLGYIEQPTMSSPVASVTKPVASYHAGRHRLSAYIASFLERSA